MTRWGKPTKNKRRVQEEIGTPNTLNESKQPTTKTLMEGFNRFLNEEDEPIYVPPPAVARAQERTGKERGRGARVTVEDLSPEIQTLLNNGPRSMIDVEGHDWYIKLEDHTAALHDVKADLHIHAQPPIPNRLGKIALAYTETLEDIKAEIAKIIKGREGYAANQAMKKASKNYR